MYEENFSNRLYQLRIQKGVSARDMSLSIGQNAGYINNIETGKAFPSMTNFFYICDYLEITPMEFFNFDSSHPKELDMLCHDLNKLSDSQFNNIRDIVHDLAKDK
jgi:transcriptional regulator with XRE-family HTH domain